MAASLLPTEGAEGSAALAPRHGLADDRDRLGQDGLAVLPRHERVVSCGIFFAGGREGLGMI